MNTEFIKLLESYGLYIDSGNITASHTKTNEYNWILSGRATKNNVFININSEPVYELQGKEMNKLSTQNEAAVAVRDRRIVIGSFDVNGTFSVAANPTVQLNSATARAECRRLASTNPGKMFVMLHLVGAELVPTTTISI